MSAPLAARTLNRIKYVMREEERDTRVWEGASEQSENQLSPYRARSMGLLETDDAC